MQRLGFGHYLNVFAATASFTTRLHLRRRRTWLMGALILLPAALPPFIAYYTYDAIRHGPQFVVVAAEYLYLYTLVPLAAVFFAGTLLSEEIEGRTFPLLLSRPAPRSALVLGKFTAFVVVTYGLFVPAFLVDYAVNLAAYRVADTGFLLGLLPRYLGLLALSLAVYGAFCLCIGTFTRRPVIIATIFVFGWEKVVVAIPGYADFLTFWKYISRLTPEVPFKRLEIGKIELPAELLRTVYPVGPTTSLIVLLAMTAVLLTLACLAVRSRQYVADTEGG
jgi:ABC-type transport system involved in multi-copper enzyme maturation permease subunit